jgi:hypothetical protein
MQLSAVPPIGPIPAQVNYRYTLADLEANHVSYHTASQVRGPDARGIP